MQTKTRQLTKSQIQNTAWIRDNILKANKNMRFTKDESTIFDSFVSVTLTLEPNPPCTDLGRLILTRYYHFMIGKRGGIKVHHLGYKRTIKPWQAPWAYMGSKIKL